MRNIITLFFRLTFFVLVFCTIVFAADIELVGTIHDGLYSPTSLCVSSDGIAVLEPYSSQIKLFTADGQATYKVDIDSDAHALTRIGKNQYLFCDRKLKNIMQVDLQNNTQGQFLNGSLDLIDPIDLIVSGELLYVLDAGQSKIITYNLGGVKQSELLLQDNVQNNLTFPTSFDISLSLNQFYVLEQTTATIFVYSMSGEFVQRISTFGNKSGDITRGGEIALDNSNRIFVTDRFQGHIVSFDSDGNFLANIGNSSGLPNLTTPTGLDIDENGIIYVASTMSASIYLFNSNIYSTSQIVQAGTVSPLDEAILEIDNLTLLAQAALSRPDIDVSFFDFQIYEDDINAADPIAIYRGTPVIDEVTLAVTAAWHVADTLGLTEGSHYKWRTRIGWESNLSEWSVWRTFSLSVLELPSTFTLSQNYPNPFNPATMIKFSLDANAPAKLEIFNLMGQSVKVLIDQTMAAGEYEQPWDGRDSNNNRVATGIYFYRLNSGNNQLTKKMVLIK